MSETLVVSFHLSRGVFRVGSSMVEQRPFKALVEGSSPSQPNLSNHSVNLINTGFAAIIR
jgi:hypothetical protein